MVSPLLTPSESGVLESAPQWRWPGCGELPDPGEVLRPAGTRAGLVTGSRITRSAVTPPAACGRTHDADCSTVASARIKKFYNWCCRPIRRFAASGPQTDCNRVRRVDRQAAESVPDYRFLDFSFVIAAGSDSRAGIRTQHRNRPRLIRGGRCGMSAAPHPSGHYGFPVDIAPAGPGSAKPSECPHHRDMEAQPTPQAGCRRIVVCSVHRVRSLQYRQTCGQGKGTAMRHLSCQDQTDRGDRHTC